MIQVIDLIETEDKKQTRLLWETVSKELSKHSGFIAANLYETFESIHPTADYQLTSFTQWKDQESWLNARSAVKSNAEIKALLEQSNAKFTAFTSELRSSDARHDELNTIGHQNMVLVDVVSVEPERMDAYASMWNNAKDFMKDKNGYVSAHLYQTVDPSSEIKFINMPEWKSAELFSTSLKTEEFFKIVDDFKDNFSLYLSNKLLSVLPEQQPS
ncbi:hypothetical protein N474_19705 [Pseudoalteromonas luteoviolacea CPMOR-2]|uniref:Uncharacterized protein n=1 Tax=Pseudoalteromonas luteoviolacea DSM 6061 TaxID=1365250 RepID=A0A161XUL3_9GAMM|nr:antibiotic biosynthesis monooxygenase [Pseudoalteromonas luteoviolacea]KZN34634.1 hypothetical protein N475_19010 [Pseudoalteromonas luteoviolacea DSM 6061]KZN53799.1 hypothetical protein N474_19705 [Pseudoalteromonas luteoviolacea CPMOR-2]MBE0389624.1 hypothetical protein [Pseudoalteromonas luteoviolacea DSM 6061]